MIQLINVNKTDLMPRVKALYLREFPEYERIPYWMLVYKSYKKNSDFYALHYDNEYIGLLYLTYYKDIVYVFYLAIDPSHQSKGYGSKVLQYLKDIYKDKRLLLNIEKVDKMADNYAQRLKRKQFYEKNGFKNTDFDIEVVKKNIVYEILYLGDKVCEKEYHALFKNYYGRILNCFF